MNPNTFTFSSNTPQGQQPKIGFSATSSFSTTGQGLAPQQPQQQQSSMFQTKPLGSNISGPTFTNPQITSGGTNPFITTGGITPTTGSNPQGSSSLTFGPNQQGNQPSIGFNPQPQQVQQTMSNPTTNPQGLPNLLGFSFPVQGGINIGLTSQKRQHDQNDLYKVLQSYFSVKDQNSNLNHFKDYVYNRISKGFENYLPYFQSFRENFISEDGKQTKSDSNLWLKALKENPSPNSLYPVQISSPIELYNRMRSTQVFLMTATNTIQEIQHNLINLNEIYDNEISGLIDNNNEKLHLIKAKQFGVAAKLEKLACLYGKAEKNFKEENKLINKLNFLKTAINERSDYLPKVEELKTKASNLDFSKESLDTETLLSDIDAKRLEKSVVCLQDMKKIFEANMNSLKKSSYTLTFMKNELKNMK